MKYRKKPVVVEATQWFKMGDHPAVFIKRAFGVPIVETLEGLHVVTPGDYIITGVKGEHYACKPDIFEMTYEPVEEQAMKENVPITNPVEMVDPNWMERTGGFAKDMTLRDWYAGLAMQGMMSGLLADGEDIQWAEISRNAYWQADAMLKAGAK